VDDLVTRWAMVKGVGMPYLKVDRASFAKVSPVGIYEVELGTPAETKDST
jgi:hypothetical protein